jgi:hypothetical protein
MFCGTGGGPNLSQIISQGTNAALAKLDYMLALREAQSLPAFLPPDFARRRPKLAAADPTLNPKLLRVNGCVGGTSSEVIANPESNYWNEASQLISKAGSTREHVQAVCSNWWCRIRLSRSRQRPSNSPPTIWRPCRVFTSTFPMSNWRLPPIAPNGDTRKPTAVLSRGPMNRDSV